MAHARSIILPLFYRWGNRNTEQSCNCHTQQGSGKARIYTHTGSLSLRPCSESLLLLPSCPYILIFWSFASTLHCGLAYDYGSESGCRPSGSDLWLPSSVKIHSAAPGNSPGQPSQVSPSALTTACVSFLSPGTRDQAKPKPSLLEL